MADSTPILARPARRRWLLAGALLALLGLGAVLYRGYGLNWDEPSDHYNGAENLTLLVEALCPPAWQARLVPHDPLLHPAGTWPGYDHGPAFEMVAAGLGRVLYPNNPQGYFQLRHLLVWGLFVSGLAVFYRLARLRYPAGQPGHQWLPLLGAAALLLSPRFFAEAFYNGKDISCLVFYMLAMLTLARLVQRPTWQRTVLHALATALAADVRVSSLVLLPAYTAGALLLQGWALPAAGQPLLAVPLGRRLGLLALYAGLALAATVAGWPYLWADPLGRLPEVLARTGHFPWPGVVLYLGQLVPAAKLPWHYLPVWIAVTTPLPYLGLALLGGATGLGVLARRGVAALRRPGGWLDLLLVGWLLGPLLLVMANHTVVYDGWRHLYFVYPALLLLALRGARALGRAWAAGPAGPAPGRAAWRGLAGAALLLIGFDGARTAWFIARAYPNQQVYFSCLPAATAERLFERDYWGPSYRHGLEWLLRHDPAPVITVTGPQPPIIYVNWLLLDPAQQRRIRLVPDARARYYFTAYRWHPQPYADTLGPEVLAYRPGGGVKALSIFRRDSLGRPLPAVPNGVARR